MRDWLGETVQNLRVGHLLLLLHFGSMPHSLTMKNMGIFSREVMAGLRTLWNGWEDEWWPRAAVGSSND